jgi:hypothetical protein
MLRRHLNGAERYLEFGMGASTSLALDSEGVKRIVTCESDSAFFAKMAATDSRVKAAVESGRLKVWLADIGETVNWGRPKNDLWRHLWPGYSLAPFSDFRDYDMVLVDGRFRMACALQAILNASKTFTLLIHDYRKRYALHRLEWSGLVTVVESVDSLVVLRPRPIANLRAVQRAIAKYQYLPDDYSGWETNRTMIGLSCVFHYLTKRV